MKELLGKYYLRVRNPFYAIDRVVKRADLRPDGTVLAELTNGIKLIGRRSQATTRAMMYVNPSKLRSIGQFREFVEFWGLLGELYVDRYYNQAYALRAGDIVLDVGAHIGAYTVQAAVAVGPQGRVVAVEPNADNLKCLRENVRLNALQNVTIIPKGVWNTHGTLTLHSDLFSGSHSVFQDVEGAVATGTSEDIPVDTVDHLLTNVSLLGKVNFIKMDIEGAEIEALAGMSETLSQTGALHLAIAAYHRRAGVPTFPLVMSRLSERGFRCTMRGGIVQATKQLSSSLASRPGN